MTIEYLLAMGTDRGDISLFDSRDNFMASYKDGRWIADDVFEAGDIYENFFYITDDNEILRLMKEARTSLGVPDPG